MKTNNTVKIRVYISTNKVGSECSDIVEFERDAWEAMSDEQKEDALQDAAFNYLEWGWEETK
jgi:hypothetical protein